MKKAFRVLMGAVFILSAVTAHAQTTVEVGGAPMYPTKDIIDNAVNSKDHTKLVAAVKAAGLVSTLKGPGPFTVFAPTNEAFSKLPDGTLDNLLKPENKDQLVKVLTYHVVAGKISSRMLLHMVRKGGGTATLKTVEGGSLTVTASGSSIAVADDMGNKANITTRDVWQKNGVIQVIDAVMLPK